MNRRELDYCPALNLRELDYRRRLEPSQTSITDAALNRRELENLHERRRPRGSQQQRSHHQPDIVTSLPA